MAKDNLKRRERYDILIKHGFNVKDATKHKDLSESKFNDILRLKDFNLGDKVIFNFSNNKYHGIIESINFGNITVDFKGTLGSVILTRYDLIKEI